MGPKKTTGIDCGSEAGAWFDKFLGKEGMRLVYCDTQSTMRTAGELLDTVGVKIAKDNLKV